MKTIKYRQYGYDGDYSYKEIEVQDDCEVYLVAMEHVGYKLKDHEGDVYTEGYLFVQTKKHDDFIRIAKDMWIMYRDTIYIEDTSIVKDITTAPVPKDAFIYYHSIKPKLSLRELQQEYFDMCQEENVDKVKLNDLLKRISDDLKPEIVGITKIGKFTRYGYEETTLFWKDLLNEKESLSSCIKITNYSWISEYDDRSKVVYGNAPKALYKQKLKYIFNTMKI